MSAKTHSRRAIDVNFSSWLRARMSVIVLGVMVAATTAAQTPSPAGKPGKPSSRDASPSTLALKQERERMDGVVAAALVTALSEQLGGRTVNIRLEHVDAQAASLRDRLVKGQGRLLIDGGDDWIAFRFDILYDAVLESAGYPELHIGGVGREERAIPNDSKLIREMDDRVVAMLGEEFGYQQMRLQLDRIATVEAGTRYLRVDADGIADFGLDGTSPLQVEALYDRKSQEWLRVAYALQPVTTHSSGPILIGK